MAERLRVGILGAGRIAQGYDGPSDEAILTVSHAIQRSSRLTIGGYFDVDPQKSEQAEAKWGVPATPRDRGAWFESNWDVVYIATPDANHVADLREAIAHSPKAIWVEKPLALKFSDGDAVLADAERRGIPVVVNYLRRWHPGTQDLSAMITSGVIGKPLFGVFAASGGAAHNGVHLFDLFAQFWGDKWRVEGLGPVGAMTHLRFAGEESTFDAVFLDAPSDQFYTFEMRIHCTEGKLEVAGSPETLHLSTLQPDPLFPGVRICGSVRQVNMDSEPLPLHAAEMLTRLIDDPEAARAHSALERSRQRFIGTTLRCLKQP